MRRLLLPLLLLSSASPAAAEQNGSPIADERSEDRMVEQERPERAERQPRVERAQPRFERVERAEPRAEPVQSAEQAPPPVFERPRRAERTERIDNGERAERQDRRERRQRWDGPVGAPETQARATDSVAGWRWRERDSDRRRRQGDVQPTAQSPVLGESLPGPRIVTPPTIGRAETRHSDRLRDRVAAEGWRREWRGDRRYDWRRHRDRDRSRFRIGIYIDPFGWNYRRWQVGWNLYPRFYSSRYWIDEPWHYRLPPAYGPYRWVRYYDDVLLIDLRSGRVVDVIHNFFW